MPCLARSIIAHDFCVEEAKASVRILGLESVNDDAFFVLSGDLLNFGGGFRSDGGLDMKRVEAMGRIQESVTGKMQGEGLGR